MGSLIGVVARLVVAGVWLYAGGVKLLDPAASIRAVQAYELLPGEWSVTIGYVLPVVEIVLGLCLLLGLLLRGAAVLSAGLFLVFVAGIASVWARGMEIDCGCFGGGGADPGAASAYPWEIARDLGLAALSALLVVWRRPGPTVDRLLFPAAALPEDVRV